MKRGVVLAVVIAMALAAATGGVAARRLLITSGRQIKPGVIGLHKLNRSTRLLIAHGQRGPQGPAGPAGSSAANALARASGLVAWTADPALISTTRRDSSGSIHGGSVWLDRADRINWLAELVTVDGSGMTHGGYAIYNSSFHLVARTADRPSAFHSAAADSWVKLPLTSRYTVPASGLYYFVDLLAGSTPPTIGVVETNSALAGANVLPSGVRRGIRGGSGFSAFPATLPRTPTDETRCVLAG